MTYPQWRYFPANARPPGWAYTVADVLTKHESQVSTAEARTGLSSDAVLEAIRPDLEVLGFEVETGKGRDQKISRTVLFGANGEPRLNYEVDAFHDGEGIAVEVEAGRGAQNGADYRDVIRTSLILDARFLVLMMPIAYRFQSGGKDVTVRAYDRTHDQIEAIYASQRLDLPFEGVLVIGY